MQHPRTVQAVRQGKPPTTAVDDLDLDIEPGEFLVLLGPSGCGKTTTLRCIAGLETADDGDDHLRRRTRLRRRPRQVNVPPNKRNIGMVFQSYALWPHMTVRKNIGYPLRARRVDQRDGERVGRRRRGPRRLRRRCSTAIPAQLSGGQQQRVALARGLVARPGPRAVRRAAEQPRRAAARPGAHARSTSSTSGLGFTAVYVTHDQSEALALGDRLAIMRAGKIEQLGTPEEVFEEPATEYVAGFIGMENRLSLERKDGGWAHVGEPVEGRARLRRPVARLARRADAPRGPATRQAGNAGRRPTPLAFTAIVADSEFGGRSMDVVVTAGGTRLHSRMPAGERGSWIRSLNAGEQVTAYRPHRATRVLRPGRRTHPHDARRPGPTSVVGV